MTAVRRWLLFGLGWVFFALGVLGAVLPVLPATPFMLLALWAFSKSSRRFHDWLYEHRIFGPPLRRWRESRVVPLWTKALAIGSMLASLGYVGLLLQPPWYALALQTALILAGIAYVARFPSRAPAREPTAPRSLGEVGPVHRDDGAT